MSRKEARVTGRPIMLWLVILSGLGLVALVLFDLRESREAQERNAHQVALRDAERGARELRTALMTPTILDLVPSELQFGIDEAGLLIPEAVGWIQTPPSFDPEGTFDAVLLDHLRRAERANLTEACEALAQLRDDPLVRGDALWWITIRSAWFAHRSGDSDLRDTLVAELNEGVPDEVSASLLLLSADAGLPAPSWASLALPRLSDSRADGILARLGERGVDVAAERLACDEARALRATLQAVSSHVGRLQVAEHNELLSTDEGLLLFFPDASAGALLDFSELRRVTKSLTSANSADPLVLGGELVEGDGEAPVAAGFAGVRAEAAMDLGSLSGATGLGLLSIALAVLCGGGAFFALRGARREAEAARLRTEFVTGVTHELKTPLTGIRLTADLLLNGYVQDEERKRLHLTRLAGESLRLGVLIDNVLDLGRFERGERGFHPLRSDLAELVAETVTLFQPIAASAKLELKFARPESSVPALVDRDALRQALLNILDNARKYGSAGGCIEVALDITKEAACISVRDFGPGVTEDERTLIFERFRRGERYRDGSIPGVGLGLYLARVLIRQHGGELACVQVAGDGARFELRIPKPTNKD